MLLEVIILVIEVVFSTGLAATILSHFISPPLPHRPFPSPFSLQLNKWTTSEKEDTTLLDLLPFLEAIVRTNVPDVRDVVRSYDGQDIPTAFRERMSKVQEAKSKRQHRGKGFLGGVAK